MTTTPRLPPLLTPPSHLAALPQAKPSLPTCRPPAFSDPWLPLFGAGGLEDTAPLDITVSEARARLVIRKHLARRISSLRTISRVELKSRTAKKHRLKRMADGMDVELPAPDEMRARGLRYHVCLSHQWRLGQDVVRVVQLRIADLVPQMQVVFDAENVNQHGGTLRHVHVHGHAVGWAGRQHLASPGHVHVHGHAVQVQLSSGLTAWPCTCTCLAHVHVHALHMYMSWSSSSLG